MIPYLKLESILLMKELKRKWGKTKMDKSFQILIMQRAILRLNKDILQL
jgi:hypothetical protein